jgi:tetratricopeptide (TPR) repeat protein
MPKTPSTKLFNLIKSLSGSEKRYFKLFASNKKTDNTSKYLLLFDAIDLQEIFDDEKLKEIIYADEPIQSRKYSELKAYLYDLILKSLHGYDEKSSVDFKIKGMLHSVRVLYKRSHYEDCKEVLQKVKKLAYSYEHFTNILEVLNWEKQIAYASMDIPFLDADLDRIDDEEKECLERLKNLSGYKNVFYKVLVNIRKNALLRSEEQRKILKKIIDNPLLKSVTLVKSHKAKLLYHRTYSLYYYAVLDHEKFYDSCKIVLTEMESKPKLLKEDVSEYISALSNFTLSCGLLEKYEEVRQNLAKFLKIKTNTLDDELKVHMEYYGKAFSLSNFTGEFEQGLDILEKHFEGLKKFGEGSFQKGRFYFQYFYIYFGIGDYDMALEYLNQWLNLPRSIERQDLQSLARILNLIVHFEMGNTMLLEYLFRSTYRFLRKRNRMYDFEKRVLTFIKDSNKIRTSRELREAFIKLKKDFEELSKVPSEKVMFQYFDFIAWLESKTKNESFSSVVKKRYKERKK